MMMRVLAILLFVAYALSFPSFPGDCQTIATDTTGRHNLNGVASGAGTFTITGPTSYTPGGGAVSVTLSSGTAFTGFLLWAQDANGVRQGVWTAGGNSQTGAGFAANTVNAAVCNNAQGSPAGTLGHNANGAKTTVTAQWTPPATAVGSLTFQAYVVQNLNNAFNNINLAVPVAVVPTTRATSAAPTTVATSAPPTTKATSAAPTTVATSALPTTRATSAAPTTVATSALPTTRATTAVLATSKAQATSAQQPATSAQLPATSAQLPATSAQQPATSAQQPVTSAQQQQTNYPTNGQLTQTWIGLSTPVAAASSLVYSVFVALVMVVLMI